MKAKTVGLTLFGVFMINFVVYVGILIGVASVATSAIKATTGRCGTEYVIEQKLPVYGSLFCPGDK